MIKNKLKSIKSMIIVMSVGTLLQPVYATSDREDTQIKLYMEHQKSTQKVQRLTEVKKMQNKNALAEIDTLNIKRKAEFDELKHKRDMQRIKLEIEHQNSELNKLIAKTESKQILEQAQEVKQELDRESEKLKIKVEAFSKEKKEFLIKINTFKSKEETFVKEKNIYEERTLESKKIMAQIESKDVKLNKLIEESTNLRETLKNKLSGMGVSLDEIESQSAMLKKQALLIETLNKRIESLEVDNDKTIYSIVYINNNEAMLKFGNNRRVVTVGSKVNNLTVHSITNDEVVLKLKNGLLRRMKISNSIY
jgi:chromosome segregation ATPase